LPVAFQDPLLDTTDPAAFSHLFEITERLGMLTTGMAGAVSLCVFRSLSTRSSAMCNFGLIMQFDLIGS
jgi:hypothetical protein